MPDPSRIQTLARLRSTDGDGGQAIVDLGGDVDRVDKIYRRKLKTLSGTSFWLQGSDDYRPAIGLRRPQRRAVAFSQAYLAACEADDPHARQEAALIKMPTATGKCGIIAALACVAPDLRRVLVMTPRKALVAQMVDDLTTRFWRKLGAAYTGDGLQEDLTGEALEDFAARLKGKARPVRTLTAHDYKQIWAERDAPRQVWVGTFNALHRLLRVEPPAHRNFYAREAQEAAAALDDLEGADPEQSIEAFQDLIRSVDLVIVDEGHHEPAFSWAQAVRALKKPTVVFSATPYRNDYKYFQVSGHFVFNLSWEESVRERIVRDVVVAPPVGQDLTASSPDGGYSPDAFVTAFAKTLAALPHSKKAIVHAGTFNDLTRLQKAFFRIGEPAVLIHDRVPSDLTIEMRDLKESSTRVRETLRPLRFRDVNLATSDAAKSSRVWLHQYKLLEGIDNSDFIEIWLYDGFGTARQLVQQIGRAIRLPDLNDPLGQRATIRGSLKPLDRYEGAPTVAERLTQRWDAYKAFEAYAVLHPNRAFKAETQLLPTLKRISPDIQYVAGEFRRGHFLDESPSIEAFVLPRRGTVCRALDYSDADTPIPDDYLDMLEEKAAEAMVLEERFDIAAIPRATDGPYRDVRLVRYLLWRNSPLLRAHQIPEWTLGVLAIVRAGRYIFLLDTEGNCLDYSRLRLAAPEPVELKRLFAAARGDEEQRVRIVETSARGLDISELGLRSISVRRHSLDSGYFDLAEASQVPTSIEGYSPLGERTARRRLSFARSSVADATNQFVSVKDYVAWAQTLATVMVDDALHPHAYFNRFAEAVPALRPDDGAPRSILLDVRDLIPEEGAPNDEGWDRQALEKILEADTCLEVAEHHDENDNVTYDFEFGGHTVQIEYAYRASVPPAGRYILRSNDLNTALVAKDGDDDDDGPDAGAEIGAFGRRLSPSLTRLINADQAFQIVTSKEEVVYSHGHFYRPDLDESLLNVLEGDESVRAAISEKGDTRVADADKWASQTLFGLVEAWAGGTAGGTLASDLGACDTLVCDDSKVETADFYAINAVSRRILVIHAKADNTKNPTASARKLQEVARQAQSSLGLAGSSRHALPLPDEWTQSWKVVMKDTEGKIEITRPRLWKSPTPDVKAAHARLQDALADPLYRTEIVVLSAGLLGRDEAVKSFARKDVGDLQFLYYLASLRSTFDRAGVRLRIVCNP